MSKKPTSGGSTPKVLPTSVKQDIIDQEANFFIEGLNSKMTSSSPSTAAVIRKAFRIFMQTYRTVEEDELHRLGQSRGEFARDAALATVGDSHIANFVKAEITKVIRRLQQSKDLAQAS